MGITDRKTIELGLGFLKFGKTIGWEMGFGQNLGKIWAGKMRFIPPFKTLSYFHFHITSRPEEPLPLILTEPVPEVFEFVPLIGQIFFMLLMVNQ